MILDKGVTDEVAKESMGIWHPLLLSTAASIMGLGFWSFITNMLMTLKQKVAPGAPADGKLAWFLGFSTIAILIGTMQGVLQTLPFIEEWLEEGSPSSYFVTPLAHAQLNMVGFVIIALSTMMIFLLPRLLGKPATFPRSGQRALVVMAVGIASTYVVYFLIGVLESIQIHNGLSPGSGTLGRLRRMGQVCRTNRSTSDTRIRLHSPLPSCVKRHRSRNRSGVLAHIQVQDGAVDQEQLQYSSPCFPNLNWAGTFSGIAFRLDGVRVPWPWLVL